MQISSNDANDLETEEVVNGFSKSRSYISFHANEFDLGIDKNHDLLYEYCETRYALLLADDDVLLDDTIKRIHENCENYEFLFAICNQRYYRNEILEESHLFYENGVVLLSKKDAFRKFTVYKPGPILPLIPYFGGIIVNLEKINDLISSSDRRKFEGTFHQYTGSLWLALLNSKENVALFTDVTIGQGFDDDKTWFDYKEEVFKNANRLYEILPISETVRRDISTLITYSGRRMGKIMIPILRIKSRRWRL